MGRLKVLPLKNRFLQYIRLCANLSDFAHLCSEIVGDSTCTYLFTYLHYIHLFTPSALERFECLLRPSSFKKKGTASWLRTARGTRIPCRTCCCCISLGGHVCNSDSLVLLCSSPRLEDSAHTLSEVPERSWTTLLRAFTAPLCNTIFLVFLRTRLQ